MVMLNIVELMNIAFCIISLTGYCLMIEVQNKLDSLAHFGSVFQVLDISCPEGPERGGFNLPMLPAFFP